MAFNASGARHRQEFNENNTLRLVDRSDASVTRRERNREKTRDHPLGALFIASSRLSPLPSPRQCRFSPLIKGATARWRSLMRGRRARCVTAESNVSRASRESNCKMANEDRESPGRLPGGSLFPMTATVAAKRLFPALFPPPTRSGRLLIATPSPRREIPFV